jgi:hypothetical protein
MKQPHSLNLSDSAECVILWTSWLPSPGKVSCRAVNIWVTRVELRVPILSAKAGHQLRNGNDINEHIRYRKKMIFEAKRTHKIERKLFSKRSEHIQWDTQGSGGHWFMKKTWSRKSRVRFFLKYCSYAQSCLFTALKSFSVEIIRTWHQWTESTKQCPMF